MSDFTNDTPAAPETVVRWYKGLAALPSWQEGLATTDSAMAAWRLQRAA
jgi:hypothetical protein